MLPIDLPSREDLSELAAVRADACVSIYLETTPVSVDIVASRIAYGNAIRDALGQLEAAGFDKRRALALGEQLDDLAEDDAFWSAQARSLAVLATPDRMRTFRLANRLSEIVQVADRFHLTPLLRAVTFPHTGFVLALSESSARLIEVFADLPAQELRVPDMPSDAASFAGKSSLKDRAPVRRLSGSEGKKVRLRQYARGVDMALRPIVSGSDVPLVLAALAPIGPIFRSVCTYPGLLEDGIEEAVDTLEPRRLAEKMRPVLDAAYAREIAAMRQVYQQRMNQRRATSAVDVAARAALAGGIESLLVDMDVSMPGTINPDTAEITRAAAASATTYDVIDEIAAMALATGARVRSVRADDLPEGGVLAATLRYAL
ncbi:MAG: hypothetical protein ACFB3T_12910 [Geminicoccaceae bacterium]